MDRKWREINRAMEWVVPLGVCCAEAQADGVPCRDPHGDCFHCQLADPVRQVVLRLAIAHAVVARPLH